MWLRQAATASDAGVTASDVVDRTTSLRDCFTAAIGHVRTGLDPQRASVAARTA